MTGKVATNSRSKTTFPSMARFGATRISYNEEILNHPFNRASQFGSDVFGRNRNDNGRRSNIRLPVAARPIRK